MKQTISKEVEEIRESVGEMQSDPDILNCEQRILKAIRRIIRSVDIYSRRLNREYSLTTPQLICLTTLYEKGNMIVTELSNQVNLSASTVNGIVDRLEKKGLARRRRSKTDRRRVHVEITEAGRDLVSEAPSLLQDNLVNALNGLPDLEQTAIALSLERVVQLMGVQELDASPNLLPDVDVISLKIEE